MSRMAQSVDLNAGSIVAVDRGYNDYALSTRPRPHAEVRVFAAMGLAMLRLDPARSVPALVGLLKDELPPVRYFACVGLGRMGHSAIGAIALLTAALEDPDPDVRSAAARAIDEVRATMPENSSSG
jgi:HEAT repeat protein